MTESKEEISEATWKAWQNSKPLFSGYGQYGTVARIPSREDVSVLMKYPRAVHMRRSTGSLCCCLSAVCYGEQQDRSSQLGGRTQYRGVFAWGGRR